jgi:hypothetical protein
VGASAPVGLFVNWLNTAFILLLITVAVAAVVGSLARQLLGSIFDLDPDTERGDSVTSDPQRPSPPGVGTPVHEAARSAPGET